MARLKVERAKRYIDELKTTIGHINTLGADRLVTTKDSNGRHILDFKALGENGNIIPLALGDAVHNLRAALDHIWAALDRMGRPHYKGYSLPSFPVDEFRERVEAKVGNSLVQKTFPNAKELILDRVKPHRDFGGNVALWCITKLDNIDKHNLLIPVITVDRLHDLSVASGGSKFQMSGNNFTTEGSIVNSSNPIEYQQQTRVTITATFPKGVPDDLFGEPVVPSLLNMAEATREVVQLFRKTFL